MASKDKSDKPAPEPTPRTRPVRDWTEALGIRRAVAAGAGALAGWTPDTQLTEADFRAGVKAYEKRPMGGPEQAPKDKVKVIRPEPQGGREQ